MMNFTVRIIGDPILRKTTKDIEKFDDSLKELIQDMFDEMYKSDGVGLAAPQVGISRSFFVMDDGIEKRAVINPKILNFSEEEIIYEEGCLSIPEIFAEISRPRKISVEYQNPEGKKIKEDLDEYTARIFQHEFDHLKGRLFTDKLSVVSKARIKKDLLKLNKEGQKIFKEHGELEI
ncbi:MAG: peptide deformylase [Oceanotoga sp.]|jgi:peptide deformylase|nr:peptide deformylase [Oceanotoga sp.]